MAKKYPYELLSTFFILLEFKRAKSLPQSIEMPITSEMKIIEPEFPRLQINLRIKSPDDTPLNFCVELVGIFRYIGENKEYDHELNREFVGERALHMLWPIASQMIRIVTGQMGMNPLETKTPVLFNVPEG